MVAVGFEWKDNIASTTFLFGPKLRFKNHLPTCPGITPFIDDIVNINYVLIARHSPPKCWLLSAPARRAPLSWIFFFPQPEFLSWFIVYGNQNLGDSFRVSARFTPQQQREISQNYAELPVNRTQGDVSHSTLSRIIRSMLLRRGRMIHWCNMLNILFNNICRSVRRAIFAVRAAIKCISEDVLSLQNRTFHIWAAPTQGMP